MFFTRAQRIDGFMVHGIFPVELMLSGYKYLRGVHPMISERGFDWRYHAEQGSFLLIFERFKREICKWENRRRSCREATHPSSSGLSLPEEVRPL